jgi:cation transport ATPase
MAASKTDETTPGLDGLAQAGIHVPATSSLSNGSVELQEHGHDEEGHEHSFEWIELARVLFVALAATAVWFRVWEPFPRISVIGLAATLIGGYPIFKEAFENILERRMTMSFP